MILPNFSALHLAKLNFIFIVDGGDLLARDTGRILSDLSLVKYPFLNSKLRDAATSRVFEAFQNTAARHF